jgi:IS30 family transposase
MPGARLSFSEREEIALGLAQGLSLRAIAVELGRPSSTISREVQRSGGIERYRCTSAQMLSTHRARRPKVRKLDAQPRLWRVVERWLMRLWSPQQICKRLRLVFPHDASMRVSHETIYQTLYVQGRGSLRKELTAALRTGRAHRREQGSNPGRGTRGKIKDMVLISERPAEIEDRAVPGHWEGDLIIGKGHKSQVGTLVERSTRLVQLIRLADGTAETVREALAKKMQKLPKQLRKTLTWDQGKEMASHKEFSIATDIQVYFCDPHSPWQRGSNENTNGLLRQYMPKGTDLSDLTEEDLEMIEDSLNGRPRQTLNWMTPSEKFAELMQ